MEASASPTGHGLGVVRVYDHRERAHGDGYRVLVDRLWPRGVARADFDLDQWEKDVAPSTDLRKWYGHDVDRFDDFRDRYLAELADAPAADALAALAERWRRGAVTLLTATRDLPHSGATVLAGALHDAVES